MSFSIKKKLECLRSLMRREQVSAYIIPSADHHNSEYLPEVYKRIAYLCGFDGSAGTAVVTPHKALLWTDGRYFLQAERQLVEPWEVMRDGAPGTPPLREYLAMLANKPSNDPEYMPSFCVGGYSDVFTVASWKRLSDTVPQLTPVPHCLVDEVHALDAKNSTGNEAPPPRWASIRPLSESYSGESVASKVERLAKKIQKKQETLNKKIDVFLFSALDDVAWLTNLRGRDILYNPVFYAYCAVEVSNRKLHLFVDVEEPFRDWSDEHEPNAAKQMFLDHIRHHNIQLHSYRDFFQTYLPEIVRTGQHIGYDPQQISQAVAVALKQHGDLKSSSCVAVPPAVTLASPVEEMKSSKNAVELQGFRACHIQDGVALVRYLAWLEEHVGRRGESITEFEGAEQLRAFRSDQTIAVAHYMGDSFETISASGPNGSMLHYAPRKDRCDCIDPDAIYLVDSGGQYLEGTTDVTRTVWLRPTPLPAEREEEKRAYTLVLKGHIALAMAVFPNNTHGHALDVLARQYLWKDHRNYRHGTGHGVGHYLNVHEGPIGISTRAMPSDIPLTLGHVLSNEPGYYKDGAFGIRIESLVEVVPAQEVGMPHTPCQTSKALPLPAETPFSGYMTFSTLTMSPFCRALIDTTLLTSEELEWIHSYHNTCIEKLMPHLKSDRLATEYLQRMCAPL